MNLDEDGVKIEIVSADLTLNLPETPQVDPYEQSYAAFSSDSSSESSHNGQDSGPTSTGSDTLNEQSTGDENAPQPEDSSQRTKK